MSKHLLGTSCSAPNVLTKFVLVLSYLYDALMIALDEDSTQVTLHLTNHVLSWNSASIPCCSLAFDHPNVLTENVLALLPVRSHNNRSGKRLHAGDPALGESCENTFLELRFHSLLQPFLLKHPNVLTEFVLALSYLIPALEIDSKQATLPLTNHVKYHLGTSLPFLVAALPFEAPKRPQGIRPFPSCTEL
jgi:hypothetical protein